MNKYGEVFENVDLTKYNTYGIHSTSDYLIKVNNRNDLLDLIKYLNDINMKYYVLGKGSNVILPDNNFNGVIILLDNLNKIEINDNIVYCEAGCTLSNLVMETINHNLSGLEYLALIPGTLGGAIVGNAGVKEHEIYDNLVNVDVVRNNEILRLNKDEIEHSYRNTMFKKSKDIIVSATFKLSNKDKKEMLEIVKDNRIKRWNTQPLEYKNAGSVFKNPKDDSAGRIIEELNLKGYNVSDACISQKHGNFIINIDSATSKDIRELIEYIQEKVYHEKNIVLELEQIIVNW